MNMWRRQEFPVFFIRCCLSDLIVIRGYPEIILIQILGIPNNVQNLVSRFSRCNCTINIYNYAYTNNVCIQIYIIFFMYVIKIAQINCVQWYYRKCKLFNYSTDVTLYCYHHRTHNFSKIIYNKYPYNCHVYALLIRFLFLATVLPVFFIEWVLSITRMYAMSYLQFLMTSHVTLMTLLTLSVSVSPSRIGNSFQIQLNVSSEKVNVI